MKELTCFKHSLNPPPPKASSLSFPLIFISSGNSLSSSSNNSFLAVWIVWWINTGHFDERGVKNHQYQMCRINDIGPYSWDNVYCDTGKNNKEDYWNLNNPKLDLFDSTPYIVHGFKWAATQYQHEQNVPKIVPVQIGRAHV